MDAHLLGIRITVHNAIPLLIGQKNHRHLFLHPEGIDQTPERVVPFQSGHRVRHDHQAHLDSLLREQLFRDYLSLGLRALVLQLLDLFLQLLILLFQAARIFLQPSDLFLQRPESGLLGAHLAAPFNSNEDFCS